MATRIIFNGQEYASPEAMPEDIRKAYLEALAMTAPESPAQLSFRLVSAGSRHSCVRRLSRAMQCHREWRSTHKADAELPDR
jgi:hypothetical protein